MLAAARLRVSLCLGSTTTLAERVATSAPLLRRASNETVSPVSVQQRRIPAAFMRGGTSNGIIFYARDLPPAGTARDRFLCAAMGSPDPYCRQLDGMGGGSLSLSKVAIVAPSIRSDADIDYTFAQVAVDSAVVDYSLACGNISAAAAAFAVDTGMIPNVLLDAELRSHTVRVYTTNTDALFTARLFVSNGAVVERLAADEQNVVIPVSAAVVDCVV
jgi:2-methylaconitate cis-trans-isomerase PrpF